jgi:hypothetical protein
MFILVAAMAHAFVSKSRPTPIHTGYVQGEVWVREANGIAHEKCNGFKVECYDSVVVVYIDKKKEPTWTGNYVKVIPWSKIELLNLMPE